MRKRFYVYVIILVLLLSMQFVYAKSCNQESLTTQELVDDSIEKGEEIICIGSEIDNRGQDIERCDEWHR